jgi:hypothetical protein
VRVQALIFVGTGSFLAIIGAIYWFTSYEPAGTVLLVLGLGLGVIPGGFLLYRTASTPALAEDRDDADPADGAGSLGTFPASSVWPVVFAGGAALTGIGLVFGAWAALPGLLTVTIAFVGATLESRGTH